MLLWQCMLGVVVVVVVGEYSGIRDGSTGRVGNSVVAGICLPRFGIRFFGKSLFNTFRETRAYNLAPLN